MTWNALSCAALRCRDGDATSDHGAEAAVRNAFTACSVASMPLAALPGSLASAEAAEDNVYGDLWAYSPLRADCGNVPAR